MYLQSIEITGALGKNYEIPAAVSVVDDVLLANGLMGKDHKDMPMYDYVFGAFCRLLISIDGRRKPSFRARCREVVSIRSSSPIRKGFITLFQQDKKLPGGGDH